MMMSEETFQACNMDERTNEEILRDHIKKLESVIQMCFDDTCKPSGKISKKTAIELMKYADTRA